jgi:uncharacterized protein YceK|tara:strand:- start:19 stop:219 length:201 start_codon:yes stop_codon:yes gene_type:complete
MKIILLLFVITILNGCAILAIKETARVTDIIATDAKDKATNNKKNDEDKDEKQNIIDCIKMVVYCD